MCMSDIKNKLESVTQATALACLIAVAFVEYGNVHPTSVARPRTLSHSPSRKPFAGNKSKLDNNKIVTSNTSVRTYSNVASGTIFGFYLDYANDEDHFSTKKGTTIRNVSDKIQNWVESAVNVSKSGVKIVLVHNYEEIDSIPLLVKLASMVDRGVILHYIDPRFDVRFNVYTSEALEDTGVQRQSPHTIRYLILEALLKETFPCTGYCIVTDITDVHFLSDPLDIMAQTDEERSIKGLPQPTIYLGDQPDVYKGWIYTSMPRCYPGVKLLQYLTVPVRGGDTWLNNGLIGGAASVFNKYIGDMVHLLKTAKYDVCDMAAVSVLQLLPQMPPGGVLELPADVPDIFIGLYNRSTFAGYNVVHGVPFNCKFSMSRIRRPITELCAIAHKS